MSQRAVVVYANEARDGGGDDFAFDVGADCGRRCGAVLRIAVDDGYCGERETQDQAEDEGDHLYTWNAVSVCFSGACSS